MRLALDANIWTAERLLRSSLGAALLYAVRRQQGTIILPATTRAELVAGLVRQGEVAVDQIQGALGLLQALQGTRPEIPLPSPEEFRAAVEARLTELGASITPLTHTPEQMQSALDRVINHRTPAHKKEEYRDALFWEVLHSAAVAEPVQIVARDAAFYEGSKFENGLAVDLREECKTSGANIEIYSSVEQFLSSLDQDVLQPDREAVLGALQTALASHFEKLAGSTPFDIGDLCKAEIEAFLTERLDQLAIGFDLEYEVQNLVTDSGVVPQATLVASGSAIFNLDTNDASNVQVSSTSFLAPDGHTLIGNRTVFLGGNIVFGIRQVPYTLRRRLP